MKFCPHETLVMPIPEVLKSLHIIPQSLHKSIRTLPWMYSDAERELMDSTRISMTMLSVFLDLIKKNNSGSLLQILDLGLFPLRKYIYIYLPINYLELKPLSFSLVHNL